MEQAFSSRILSMKASATVATTALAAELRRQGRDIIAMSAGEPDLDTPEHIKEAGIRAIRDGHTKYTAPASGLIELKEAIAHKLHRENDLSYDPTQIVVTCGAKQVIFDAIVALIEPGDEVVLPAPLYVSYADQVKLMGGKPVIVQTDPDDGFCLDADQLQDALTPRSKLIMLNSPCNPTGGVYPGSRLAALAKVIAEAGIYTIADEIYEKFIYGDEAHVSIASLNEAVAERCLTVNGFSKAYAMTGWRVGYGAGPSDLMAHIAKIQTQETTNTCTISQHAAIAALEGPQDSIGEMKAIFEHRRNLIADRLDALPGISCPRPEGAFYVFPNVRGALGCTLKDDVALCTHWLEEVGVAAVPGAGFQAPGYVRFSYTLPNQRLEEGIVRVEKATTALGEVNA